MTKAGFCKICSYFKHAKWNLPLFEKEVAEGKSLRALKMLLLGMGLKVSEKTISAHFRHMDNQIIAHRKHETSVKKKLSNPFKKVSKFFIKTAKVPITTECKHLITETFYSIPHERVFIRCANCKELLASYDPEEQEKRMRKDPRNWKLLRSLRK